MRMQSVEMREDLVQPLKESRGTTDWMAFRMDVYRMVNNENGRM